MMCIDTALSNVSVSPNYTAQNTHKAAQLSSFKNHKILIHNSSDERESITTTQTILAKSAIYFTNKLLSEKFISK